MVTGERDGVEIVGAPVLPPLLLLFPLLFEPPDFCDLVTGERDGAKIVGAPVLQLLLLLFPLLFEPPDFCDFGCLVAGERDGAKIVGAPVLPLLLELFPLPTLEKICQHCFIFSVFMFCTPLKINGGQKI